ncbi:MAG TPA: HAMP domain-containing sensor histidine kinase [Gemmatimonadaceae bacterium]|nr:HAMP domain-containing sensor histidine kinase [Gemmatimonadaceae bacterium]
MEAALNCQLAEALAERLRGARDDLVRRWLERISARVSLTPNRVFPSNELLNHVPLLIDGIAHYLESPDADLDAEAPVIAKAIELGALRHGQGFSAYEILKEFELLSGILLNFFSESAEEVTVPYTARDPLVCWQRVSHAVELIRQATTTHFLQLSEERVREREERLRRFNRMVSHELKNRMGAIRGASALLGEGWLDGEQHERFRRMVSDNADALERVLRDLEVLSRVESDARQQRNVLLPQAAAEAARQLRTMAEARGVEVRVAEDLPDVEVNAAAVELCLTNYISNAIKYSDPAKDARWVEVAADQAALDRGQLIVQVRDNGLGVPPESREQLFQQFFRAHRETVTGVEGTGLGLSIVRDTVESMGGRAWAEFPDEGGAVFAFSLPARRQQDAELAGTGEGGRGMK